MYEEDSSKIIDVVDEKDETDEQENMITFIIPSQFDQSCSGMFFKCEVCDFISARKTIIKDHKESTHNWWSICFPLSRLRKS